MAVWDFTSAFHDGASSRWLLDVYVVCLDFYYPTCNRGQDAAACYGGRLGELGEGGEISIASWDLLIVHTECFVFAFCTIFVFYGSWLHTVHLGALIHYIFLK